MASLSQSTRQFRGLLRTTSSARCAITRTRPQSIAALSTTSSPSSSSSSSSSSTTTLDSESGDKEPPKPPLRKVDTSRWFPNSSSINNNSVASSSNSASTATAPPTRYDPLRNPAMDPKKTVDAMQAWFRERFPALALPDDVVLQAVTHESFDHGLGSRDSVHNRRLAFLGRRAMQMFLAVFLEAHLSAALLAASTSGNASTTATAAPAVQRLLDSVADVEETLLVQRLGDDVGRHLALEEVMRWRPAVADGQAGPKQMGLFKIRGVAVEALVGAIYHQHGAETARAFFHVHVLPHLGTFSSNALAELQPSIDREAQEGQRLLDARAREQAAS